MCYSILTHKHTFGLIIIHFYQKHTKCICTCSLLCIWACSDKLNEQPVLTVSVADSLICTPPKPIRAGSTGSTLFVTVNQLWGSGNNIFKKTRKKTVILSFKIWISSMFLHVSWHTNAFVLCLLELFYQFSRTVSLVKYSISLLLHNRLVIAIANNKTKTTV